MDEASEALEIQEEKSGDKKIRENALPVDEKRVSYWDVRRLVEKTKKECGHFKFQKEIDDTGGELAERAEVLRRTVLVNGDLISDFDETFINEDSARKNIDKQAVFKRFSYLLKGFSRAGFKLTDSGLPRAGLSMHNSLDKNDIERKFFTHAQELTVNEKFLKFSQEYKNYTGKKDLHMFILSRNSSYLLKSFVYSKRHELLKEGIYVDGVIGNDFIYDNVSENGEDKNLFKNVKVMVTTESKPRYDPGGMPFIVDKEEHEELKFRLNTFNIQSKEVYYPRLIKDLVKTRADIGKEVDKLIQNPHESLMFISNEEKRGIDKFRRLQKDAETLSLSLTSGQLNSRQEQKTRKLLDKVRVLTGSVNFLTYDNEVLRQKVAEVYKKHEAVKQKTYTISNLTLWGITKRLAVNILGRRYF